MSDLFGQINDVWESKSTISTKTKPESVFMTNRFLSLDPNGFLAAVDCNRMRGLQDWAALSFLKYATPPMPAPRNKYPKKVVQGKKLTDRKKAALKRVCVKFNVSDFHGLQIVQLLEGQGFQLETN